MDLHTTVVAERLNADRASALARETELRRSLADRGTTITPERPVVTALKGLGVWLSRPVRQPTLRLSH